MMRRVRAALIAVVGSFFLATVASAGTITVPAGGDLQAALNQAQPGDTILLAAGATYTGNFVLPAKGGTSYITIRSSAADSSLPATDVRITPTYANALPKLQSPNSGQAAIATAPGASYYILQFLEFLPNPAGTGAQLDLGTAEPSQNTVASEPHDLIVDRCYVHGVPGSPQIRGIALNSAKTTIKNCYISEIKYAGQDSQAIAGWNGTGPYTITNNYLEAAGENFLLGGSTMFIPNGTPTGIEFRNNYLTKQAAWRNSSWTVKNIFELKHGQDVVIDGNVFENIWLAAQPGYAILFTPRNQYNDNPWTVVQRVTFTNNIVRHASSAFNILGWDDVWPSQQTNHITIRNNVLEDVNAATWGGSGRLMLISEASYVTVDHNTVFNSGSAIYAYNTASNNFVFTNNIVNTATYGIIGDGTGEGNGAISTYFPGSSFAGSVFVACTSSAYPAGNSFADSYSAVGFVNLSGGDYHLASGSAYKGKGSDGKDPGADIDALKAALANSTASGTTPPSTPPADAAPTVSLTAPAAGATFAAPATITVSATASDGDSTGVSKVEFYANGTLIGTSASSPYTVSWANVAAGSYSITAVATDTAGLKGTSSAVAVKVTAPVSGGLTVLPTPWTDGDIGSTGAAGGATYASSTGVFTVKGAGADIWGTADAFNFASQPLAGDGEVVARVSAVQNTNSLAKAGIMLRDGLSAGAAHVLLDVKPSGGVEFMTRTASGGTTAYITGTTASAPVWLKLSRAGSVFTASTSADGKTWTTLGTKTVSMASSLSAGLLVCSHVAGTLNTSTFDNVSVRAATATAAVSLTGQDIGAVGAAGSTSVANGVYTVKGAGANIWGTADAFQFASRALGGDGEVVARVSAVQNTNPMAKAGVMLRDGLTPGAAHVILDVKPSGGVEFMTRTTSGGTTTYIAGTAASAPVWLKLTRVGSVFTAYASADGKTWTTVGSKTVSMASSVSAGLVVCSHVAGTLNTSTFDNVSVRSTAAVATAAAALTGQDIGTVGVAGSTSTANGVYTVNGAGDDIWGTDDSFHFASQALGGDGQVVARLTSMQNTDPLAKAGVTIRNSLAANAAHVTLNLNPGGDVEFTTRPADGGSTNYLAGATASLPSWLKLVRSGTTVTAYLSSDGATWTQVGSTTVTLGATVYAGVVVCSHTTSALNTSTFDQVTVGK